jgi:hypothetical protein
MAGNDSLSLRELYTTVLENHAAGWATSFMSGFPTDVESIVGAYDLVVFELGKADSAERVDRARRVRRTGVDVVTHVEGPEAGRLNDELLRDGIVAVANPLNVEHIEAALDQVASRRKQRARGPGPRERLRRFLGR